MTTTHALTTFSFTAPEALQSTTIRVVEIAGEPWFVASDVADVLGFKTTAGAGWYARHLEASERNTITLSTGRRGNPYKTVISESGFYKLVMRSDKPEARPFQNWVTQVVLPAIFKDGGYIMGEENVKIPEDEDALVLRAMEVLQRKVKRLAEEKTKLTIENDEMPEFRAETLIH